MWFVDNRNAGLVLHASSDDIDIWATAMKTCMTDPYFTRQILPRCIPVFVSVPYMSIKKSSNATLWTSSWSLYSSNSLSLSLSSYLSLYRAGQPRGQGDRDPLSGAPAAWEEQTDAGAADETPGHVGGDIAHTDNWSHALLCCIRHCAPKKQHSISHLYSYIHIAVILLSSIVVDVHPWGGPPALMQCALKIESHQPPGPISRLIPSR